MDYTEEELEEFTMIVEKIESHDQMERINGRFEMPKFIEKHGKDKCNVMFEVIS